MGLVQLVLVLVLGLEPVQQLVLGLGLVQQLVLGLGLVQQLVLGLVLMLGLKKRRSESEIMVNDEV